MTLVLALIALGLTVTAAALGALYVVNRLEAIRELVNGRLTDALAEVQASHQAITRLETLLQLARLTEPEGESE